MTALRSLWSLLLLGLWTLMAAPAAQAATPFVTTAFSADPSAHVFGGRMYVYPSHDRAAAQEFDMTDYHVYSTIAHPHKPVSPPKHPARAQPLLGKPATDPTAAMTPQQFEGWITTVCGLLLDRRQAPDAARKALLARLRSGRYVTDASVIALVASAAAAEAPGVAPGTVTPSHLADTVGLIDTVLGLSYGRPGLAAELHWRKAGLYEAAADSADAVREYAQATDLLTPLHVAMDQQRVDSLVQGADLLSLMGQSRKAEPLYLEALSYDWYDVKDPQAMRSLRDLYVRAGLGLIDCHRGNLAALKELNFGPVPEDELGSALQRAIEQAEGVKVKRDPPSKQYSTSRDPPSR